ncbi:MAG: pilus assembly protein PilM [Kiritimatiellia bacterium]|nr:pilus assembly protein PilM [Kiritimatiellia bacterium]
MALLNINTLIERLKRGTVPQEVVAVDFSQVEIKCARLCQINDGKVQLLAADVLPRIRDGMDADQKSNRGLIGLPKHLLCRCAVLCLSSKNALIKLLNIPGHLDDSSEAKIRENMGVGAGDYRIGYKVLGHSQGRVETKLLTVALPESELQRCLGYFSSGWPVPIAVEPAGLAAINAFISGYLDNCADESLGVVQLEDDVSFFAFIHKKELVLIRKYDFGHDHMLNAIQSRLNVNRATALNVASDQSFDISQMIKEVCDPFVRQMVISKHFVERRENCRVSRIFIPGAAPASHRLAQEIRVASEAEVEQWDPYKAVIVQPEAIAPRLAGQYSLLAAAIGAGIGFFGEK